MCPSAHSPLAQHEARTPSRVAPSGSPSRIGATQRRGRGEMCKMRSSDAMPCPRPHTTDPSHQRHHGGPRPPPDAPSPARKRLERLSTPRLAMPARCTPSAALGTRLPAGRRDCARVKTHEHTRLIDPQGLDCTRPDRYRSQRSRICTSHTMGTVGHARRGVCECACECARALRQAATACVA
jgi:hypothetical protein